MIYSRIVLVYFAYVYIYTCDERFLRVKCRREESRLKTFARPEAALRSSRCLLPPTGLLGARLRCDCVFSKATNSCRSREALAEGAAGFSLFCGRARYVVCRCRLFFLHLCTTHANAPVRARRPSRPVLCCRGAGRRAPAVQAVAAHPRHTSGRGIYEVCAWVRRRTIS